MSTATLDAPPDDAPRTLTLDEFEQIPDERRYELVDGVPQERGMSFHAGVVIGNLYYLLFPFVREHRLGALAVTEVDYVMFPDRPRTVRKPDASFIRGDRLAADHRVPDGYVRMAPDFAFEAISPTDRYADVLAKVEEYLRAGVRLVWLADPGTRVVLAFRPDGTVERFAPGGTLAAADLFPGWSAPADELFAGA